jgi:hypothetical protein
MAPDNLEDQKIFKEQLEWNPCRHEAIQWNVINNIYIYIVVIIATVEGGLYIE